MSSKSPVFDSRIKLRVTGGRHAGAVSSANGGPQLIGSSVDADIVLTDKGVSPRHARIASSRHEFELEALEGVVAINGGSLTPGQRIKSQYPATIEVGEAKIEIVRDEASGRKVVESFLTAGGVVLIALAGLADWHRGARDRDMAGAGGYDAASAGAPLQRLALPGPETANAAADALRQHLLSQRIATIDVKAGAGTVTAAGSVTPDRQADWQSAQIWFDESFGQNILLKSDVAILAAKPMKAPITIQSVWLGDTPYLIDGEGRKFFVGSMIRDGWVLEKVEEGKVLVSKDKQPLVLRY
jgi:type III secretion protein D